MAADDSATKTSIDRLLTPRELAEAIGASESSVRRWVDAGEVKLSRTSGGHRRIPVAEAVRFIRRSRATLVRPDLLGLGELTWVPGGGGRDEAERLHDALAAGDRALARGIFVSGYLAGRGMASLFDGPLRAAMGRLGELWTHGDEGILVEHRATEIVLETLAHLRTILPPPAADAPVAVGGAPSGEFYAIPSLCASVVLAEAGFRDVNYGPNTPPLLLAAAAEQQAARLVWVSISTGGREAALQRELTMLASRIEPRGATLVVGGRHAYPHVPRRQANVVEMQSMAELSAFAAGVVGSGAPSWARAKSKTRPAAQGR